MQNAHSEVDLGEFRQLNYLYFFVFAWRIGFLQFFKLTLSIEDSDLLEVDLELDERHSRRLNYLDVFNVAHRFLLDQL